MPTLVVIAHGDAPSHLARKLFADHGFISCRVKVPSAETPGTVFR